MLSANILINHTVISSRRSADNDFDDFKIDFSVLESVLLKRSFTKHFPKKLKNSLGGLHFEIILG